ncbi:MAG: Co2+/Mg2+ efflux protein ApaG [Rhodoblastus sp.]|nr:MAG: Co2+/Mg2+ efflux protein ApaG [Rhodoblastus sp.]
MYEAITRTIRVTADPAFSPERSDAEARQFVWTYTITIANEGESAVQVMTRRWRITDAQGRTQEVSGSGVVGQQPIIAPGESFRYTSACPLTTPSGFMSGSYRCVDEDGRAFDVEIPAFSLDCPHLRRVVN